MMTDRELWWIEREDGDKVAGPWETENDAFRARQWVEQVMHPETFWIRSNKKGIDE